MESNKFELTGKVNWLDVKATDKGSYITRAIISKKIKDDVYHSFVITMFGDIAAKFGDNVKAKQDTVHVTGRLSMSSYQKDGKNYDKIDLIVNEYEKVVYSESAKGYVAIDTETDEVPWGN
jgi:single-stranded DNA-binding protein